MGCSPPPPVYCTTVVIVYPPPPPPPSGPPPPPPPPPPPLVPLELQHCTIDAYIADVHSVVYLYQTFYNPNTVPASGIYTFSMLAGSAICGFQMIREKGKLLDGEVKDRVKAQKDYDNAVKRGQTAALGKEVTKDVFSICVGNLKAKETISIKLSYINTLIDNENLVEGYFVPQLRFTVPRAYVQRYGQGPSGEIDKNIKTNIPFKFTLHIQQAGAIERIQTPIGDVAPDSKEPNTAIVAFSSGDQVPADKDIIIVITAKGLEEARAFIEHHPLATEKTTAVALTWMPDLDSTVYALIPPPEMEYIVLVDRSDSMEGIKMRAVKDILPVLLRKLSDPSPYHQDKPPPKAYFNILSYGETAKALYPSSIEHTAQNVDQAIVEIKRMEADMGKKDILQALQKVFESVHNSQASQTRPVSIYLMTDGVVYNVQECMRSVRDQILERQKRIHSESGPCPPAAETFMRMFTVGLGHGVSTELCDGIARAGFGYSTYITQFTSPDDVMGRCARLVSASQMPPIASDFKFSWETSSNNDSGPPRGPGPVQNPNAWTTRQAPKVLPDIFPFTRSNAYQILGTRADTGTVGITSLVPSRPNEKISLFKTIPQKLPASKSPFIHVCAAKAVITDLEDSLYLSTYSSDEAAIKAEIIRVGILYQLTSRYTSFVVIDDGTTVGVSRQLFDYTPDPNIWGPGPVRLGDTVKTTDDPSTVLRELVKLQQSDGSFGSSSEKVIDLIKPHLPSTVYTSLQKHDFGDEIVAALLAHLWITLKCADEGVETKKKTDEWLKKNAQNVDIESLYTSLSAIITSSPNN